MKMIPLSIPCMDVQKWDVDLATLINYQAVLPDYVPHCQMWQDQLLLGAPNITILSLGPNVSCYPVLGILPLRHLELVVEKEQPWLAEFLRTIHAKVTLESLTILSQAFRGALPDMNLSRIINLRHLKLQNLLPTGTCYLPEGCLLHYTADGGYSREWQKHGRGLTKHTSVLDISMHHLEAWPAGSGRYSNLQCLTVEMPFMLSGLSGKERTQTLDIADLQHIPHVRLINLGQRKVKLTAGSWQSLDIRRVKCLAFTDISAFLKGTKNFTFDFYDSDWEVEAVSASAVIRSACQNNDVQYYECSATAVSTAEQVAQAYTKHAKKLCGCPQIQSERCGIVKY